MSNASDFKIEDGVLTKYVGPGGDVVIPEGVTKIGSYAFGYCENLTSITIPNSVTSIGDTAFRWCENLTSITIPDSVTSIGDSAFERCKKLTSITIPNSVTSVGSFAFSNCINLTSVTIPNGVTSIGGATFSNCENLADVIVPNSVTNIDISAFSRCKNLTNIIIPNGVTRIAFEAFRGCTKLAKVVISESVEEVGDRAFENCVALEKIEINNPALSLGMYVFGEEFPKTLIKDVANLYPFMKDVAIKKYLMKEQVWDKIDKSTQAKIFLNRREKTVVNRYADLKLPLQEIGEKLLEVLAGKPAAKDIKLAITFIRWFYEKAELDLIQKIYSALKGIKSAAKQLDSFSKDKALMQLLNPNLKAQIPPAEALVKQALQEQNKSVKDLENTIDEYYTSVSWAFKTIFSKDGKEVASFVLMWLLIAHEEIGKSFWGEEVVVASYQEAAVCPKAQEVLKELNMKSFQQALESLAEGCLGYIGRSKKMYLAYPICRYADEKLMAKLTKQAPSWRSKNSGNETRSFLAFRKACLYSNTRAAMVFADKFGDLEEYAKLRGTDADTIRDQHLSDVGFDENGCIKYDLGNQTVTAALQKDLTVLMQLPDGKTEKTLPKKGADKEKYALANEHFKTLTSNIKKIVKGRVDNLFEDFLSGRARPADEWKKAYLGNPLLRSVAQLLVWEQSRKTFTIAENGAIAADSSAYAIDAENIKLAHPMEMKKDDLAAWQQYYVNHRLKQPFSQIWEPVVDAETVRKDRYKDCMIPYYRFIHQEKHGITVEDYDFHNDIFISFKEIGSEIERIDMRRHEIRMDDRFEIKAISFEKMTRRINHILAYLDRVTVYDRIAKDDITIGQFLPQFTAAQMVDFIKLAQENNANNTLAILLEFKNQHYPDLDPLAEFVLE